MFNVSLFVCGGLGLLLGSVVLLVVCSGINDRFYARPQPSVDTSPLRVDIGKFMVSDLVIN
jgi:hypothetical protein